MQCQISLVAQCDQHHVHCPETMANVVVGRLAASKHQLPEALPVFALYNHPLLDEDNRGSGRYATIQLGSYSLSPVCVTAFKNML